VTSAFLVRNLTDLTRGLAEMRRVAKPGGLVVTLDITRPAMPGWDRMFGFYFQRIVPLMGALVAGDRAAYTYLPESVERFASPPGLADAMPPRRSARRALSPPRPGHDRAPRRRRVGAVPPSLALACVRGLRDASCARREEASPCPAGWSPCSWSPASLPAPPPPTTRQRLGARR